MSIEIDCPSGLLLRVRGLKGKEGRLLSDKAAIRNGVVLDNILSACTEEVLEPGPYEPKEDGKLDWNKVLLGDRVFVLLKIRVASFGSDYSFKVQCKEQGCRTRFDYEIDLEKLEIKRLSEDDQAAFRDKNQFSTNLRDGTAVAYRLATGADEKMIARTRGQERALVDLLALRITSIDGVGEVRQSDIGSNRIVKDIRRYLEDLDWSELVHLLNALDVHDCGVETEIEIECPDCGGVQEVQLPFERGFFLPMDQDGLKRLP